MLAWLECKHPQKYHIFSSDDEGSLSSMEFFPYENLVTSERSGVVTRAAEPRTTTAHGRISEFSVSSVYLYWSYRCKKRIYPQATAEMWRRGRPRYAFIAKTTKRSRVINSAPA